MPRRASDRRAADREVAEIFSRPSFEMTAAHKSNKFTVDVSTSVASVPLRIIDNKRMLDTRLESIAGSLTGLSSNGSVVWQMGTFIIDIIEANCRLDSDFYGRKKRKLGERTL